MEISVLQARIEAIQKSKVFEGFVIFVIMVAAISVGAKTYNISSPVHNLIGNLDKIFVFTGTFIYGPRTKCKEAVESKKGKTSDSLTQKVDYLVIGSYVTSSWKHENYGNKIEKAIKHREKHGSRPVIICDDHFVKAL